VLGAIDPTISFKMADNNQPRISSSDFKPPANYNQMSEQEQKQTYLEWAKQKYNEQYESWMPWIEDHFLKYFTKDNKASYATKRECFITFPSLAESHWL
jgi:hypothetical protein